VRGAMERRPVLLVHLVDRIAIGEEQLYDRRVAIGGGDMEWWIALIIDAAHDLLAELRGGEECLELLEVAGRDRVVELAHLCLAHDVRERGRGRPRARDSESVQSVGRATRPRDQAESLRLAERNEIERDRQSTCAREISIE